MQKSPRYVVVDLNALDTDLRKFVTPDDHIVISHSMMSDIAGSNRYLKHREMFPKWYRERGDQIWIAYEWLELLDKETQPRSRTVGLAWRDDWLSRKVRLSAKVPSDSWAPLFDQFQNSTERASYEQARASFVAMCKNFANRSHTFLDESTLKRIRSDDFVAAATELIREPVWGGIWPRKFRKIKNRDYRSERWVKALEQFPDTLAFGRMSRILCWYGLTYAAGSTRKFENNHEDSAYAFTASYTGFLATDDRRLIDLVSAVFPWVQVLTSSNGKSQ